tara:strand:- start:7112 stop:7813 length:702 start_codon:yes stop_codon:yes gene_type:complete
MIKVISFDLDDTLWPILPVIMEAEKITRKWLIENYSPIEILLSEDILLNIRKDLIYKDKDLINRLSELRTLSITELAIRAGYSSVEASKIGKEAFEVFFEARNNVTFYDDVLKVLESLNKKYILGGLTNGNADIKKIGLDRFFDFNFSSSDLNSSKPSPENFHAIIRETERQPFEICHVGDNPSHDVLGAINSGFQAIWFNPTEKKWELEKAEFLEAKNWLEIKELILNLDQT